MDDWHFQGAGMAVYWHMIFGEYILLQLYAASFS